MDNIVLEDADVNADSSSGYESLEEVARSPLGRDSPPAVVAPLAMDQGMWLNKVNVKPTYLEDIEVAGKWHEEVYLGV